MIRHSRNKERWVPVPGYENRYLVSRSGKIKSLNYRSTGKPTNLKYKISHNGYFDVGLFNGKRQTTYRVNRIVAMAFFGNPPSNIHEVNHKDGNKQNNRIENLEWCTHRENTDHAIATGLRYNVGQYHGNAVLNDFKVIAIKSALKYSKIKQSQIAKFFGVCKSCINHIAKERQWTHIKIN